MSHDDEFFMREALAQAQLAAEAGEVPIGAVVVYDGQVIARAHNRRELDEDPSAHAEFSAMLQAAQTLGRWRLTGCTVYVTLEPCLMCAGLMVNARIDRCVFGAADPKGGATGSLYSVNDDDRLNHAFEVTGGVLREECARVLSDFFAELRVSKDGAGERRTPEIPDCCCGEVASAPAAPAPRVLLAIDSFKGSATSAQVEAWTAEGINHACPQAECRAFPIADGGEGTVEAVRSALGGELRTIAVEGPLGQRHEASYLLVPAEVGDNEPFAVIEMAEASGITLSGRTHPAALTASTFGVGQLMLDAVQAGATKLYIGLGGSATSDGGAGALMALGARLTDASGQPIERGLAGLQVLAGVDLELALRALQGVEIVVLSDVTNPLVGKRGALRVFGPQKGFASGAADATEREQLFSQADAWLVDYARLLTAARDANDGTDLQVAAPGARPASLAGVPGGGAAGGLGAALVALGARMTSGIECVLDIIGFDDAVAAVDLVITGEGNMDGQSAAGKAPVGVARRAKRAGKPVAAIVGGRAADLDDVYAAGIDLVLPVCTRPMTLEAALQLDQAHENICCAGESAIRAFLF